MKKTGIIIVNLGTPDSFATKDVARYLKEFLMDKRVIDVPYLKRVLLVKGIIVPFRAPKVAREYQKLWLKDGSPLLVHGKRLVSRLIKKFNNAPVEIELAMRYQNPSIERALGNLKEKNVDKIIVFPLFPQYASATTGSVAEKIMEIVSEWEVIPSIEFVNSYHDNSKYIDALVDKIKPDHEKYAPDHVLFSYHGIPERHLKNIINDDAGKCDWPNCGCENKALNKPYCYRSACFKTSELLATKLGLSMMDFSTSFQSRLGKDPWIKPYTDDTIKHLTVQGVKKLLVVSPSFVADCLETTLEIGEEYKELFLSEGGTAFNVTACLNSDDSWVSAVHDMLSRTMTKHKHNDPEVVPFNETNKLVNYG
ncbi:ferrochelatase [Fulvivirga sp. M361]|uniref:ferrochelatase n=1 Tax=Fulvivirga sp. M361 TaxID=2594266 RepID=UPI00117B5820|nr:ferrochelatase [Fulvivirga sp. M361]TRX60792.1 ferrochelatase [Fulvivirga sp. M361]